ncbi:hypothetical protein ACTHAM_001318 [Cellulomonas soli]|uniref:hypothetical protein n=1 Tax=Cellulomonas soli TaxID=931535 RepID=UPI003F8802E1
MNSSHPVVASGRRSEPTSSGPEADLGFGSIEEMGSHIDDLMGASAGRLRDDGTRFWIDYANSAIVFRGPNAAIPGTFYRPDNFLRAVQQNLDRTVIP